MIPINIRKAQIGYSSHSLCAIHLRKQPDQYYKSKVGSVAEGVVDVFDQAGLDKPNVGLLSDEFLDDVRNMKERNLAVELLEKLLKDEVKARMKNDVVSEKAYSDRILETLRKYHNRAIETAQVIEELIKMAKDMEADLAEAEKLGMNADEIAFYRALIQNEAAVRELGDNNLRELAKEITTKLRKSTTVDWQKRYSVRARLRNLVRRALRRFKYPPDRSDEAIELCLKQAEVLSESWSERDNKQFSESDISKLVINKLYQDSAIFSIEHRHSSMYKSEELHEKILEYTPNVNVEGHFGSEGGTYVKMPALLQMLQDLMTADGFIGEIIGSSLGSLVPLNCINAIYKKLFGNNIPLTPESCLVLTSFPRETIRTVDELLTNASKNADYLGVRKLDENDLGRVLNELKDYELLSQLGDSRWEIKAKVRTVF